MDTTLLPSGQWFLGGTRVIFSKITLMVGNSKSCKKKKVIAGNRSHQF